MHWKGLEVWKKAHGLKKMRVEIGRPIGWEIENKEDKKFERISLAGLRNKLLSEVKPNGSEGLGITEYILLSTDIGC